MPHARRNPKPLDAARLEELALAYVARFATTRAKLEAYLRRKVRERGWGDDAEPPILEIAERFSGSGYVDDAAYARAKAGSLLRRGYGAAKIGQALSAAGVEAEIADSVSPGEAARRDAALSLARKRRFGPFGILPLDRQRREKQLAALLRAGHAMTDARELVDAPDIEAAERWVLEAGGEDQCE